MRAATKKLIVNKAPSQPSEEIPPGLSHMSSNNSNQNLIIKTSPLIMSNSPFPILSPPPLPSKHSAIPDQSPFPEPLICKKIKSPNQLPLIQEKNEDLEMSANSGQLKKILPPPKLNQSNHNEKNLSGSNSFGGFGSGSLFKSTHPPSLLPSPLVGSPQAYMGSKPGPPPLLGSPNPAPASALFMRNSIPCPNVPRIDDNNKPQNLFAPNPANHFSRPAGPMPFPQMSVFNNPGFNQPQRIPTNIFEITFEDLKKPQVLSTGDPLRCSICKSFFSHISQPDPSWKCEFCGSIKEHDLDPEEFPKHNKILYLLKNSSQTLSKSFRKASQTIIFCIDISGSMCVTVPVSNSSQIKTNKMKKMKDELMSIVGPEWMEGVQTNFNYISRLDCVQAAIENQLETFSVINPECKIGLITFNNEVCIIGDGTSAYTIAGDALNSIEAIRNVLENKFQGFLNLPIKNSKKILQEKLLSLSETGSTALGPALLASVLLAGQSGAGSKVIVCTDGVANTGLGDIENQNNSNFYFSLSELAQDKGVEVSVISISDQECRLNALIPIVEKTGGELNKVNPETLSQDFANILSTQVYATNTKVIVRLSDGLEFKDKSKILYKDIGNVNDDTMFTFEFIINEQILSKSAPIQVEIQYKDMQSNLFALVHTENFEISENQDEVIKEANFEILSKNAQFQGANLIKEGKLREASESFNMWGNFMMKNQSSSEQSLECSNLVNRTSAIQQKIQSSLNPGLNLPQMSSMPQFSQPGPRIQPMGFGGGMMPALQTVPPAFGIPQPMSNFKPSYDLPAMNFVNQPLPNNYIPGNAPNFGGPSLFGNIKPGIPHAPPSLFGNNSVSGQSLFPIQNSSNSSLMNPSDASKISDDLVADSWKLIKNQKK